VRKPTVTKAERAAALKVANAIRKMLGKRPVKVLKKGCRSNGICCPIARTVGHDGVFVTAHGDGIQADWPGGGFPVSIPSKRAKRFVVKFDGGFAPDLEGK
jgi:hypothetical protein